MKYVLGTAKIMLRSRRHKLNEIREIEDKLKEWSKKYKLRIDFDTDSVDYE